MVFNTFIWCQMFNMINARKISNELNVFAGLFASHIFWAVWVLCVAFQVGAVRLSITSWGRFNQQEGACTTSGGDRYERLLRPAGADRQSAHGAVCSTLVPGHTGASDPASDLPSHSVHHHVLPWRHLQGGAPLLAGVGHLRRHRPRLLSPQRPHENHLAVSAPWLMPAARPGSVRP